MHLGNGSQNDRGWWCVVYVAASESLGESVIFILLATATWIPPILGYGALLHYQGDLRLRRAVTGMLGIGVLIVFGILLNFALPLSPLAAPVWLVGLFLFFRRRRWVLEGLSATEILGAGAALVFFSLLILPHEHNFDIGLYYLQTVKWISERPIQVGLANVHGRLAFNSGWFIFASLLHHPWAPDGGYFANLLPMTFTAAAVSVALERLIRGDRSYPNLGLAFMVVPLAHATTGLGGAAPDYVMTVLVPLALVLWAHSFALGSQDDARAATLLCVLATVIKISAAPLLPGSLLALALRYREYRPAWMARLGAMIAVGIGPWVLRSVFLSGCLVYPVVSTCFARLRWMPDAASVRGEKDWLASWARLPRFKPDQVLGNWAWLPSWWKASVLARPDILLLLALIVVGLLCWLVSLRATSRALAVPFAVAFAGSVFWFLSAPDPRFGLGFLHALWLLPLAFVASHPRLFSHPLPRAGLCAGLLATAGYLLKTMGMWGMLVHGSRVFPVLAWPAPIDGTVGTEVKVTASGYQVRVPIKNDQCFAAELPCTPYFDARLTDEGVLTVRQSQSASAR